MPELLMRIGSVEVDDTLPGINALAQAAEDAGIKIQDGKRRYAEEIETSENGDYLYLYYTQEVAEERSQFVDEEEEDESEEENQRPVRVDEFNFARSMRFILREDGYYAFQSTRGVRGADAIEFLLDEYDITEFRCDPKDSFRPEWMKSFYRNSHMVRKVKVKNIGEVEDVPERVESDHVDLAEGAGEPAEWATFSTSGRDNNLRTSSLINALALSSDIDFVSAKNNEGNIEKLKKSGRLAFRYPADLDHPGQAERMYQATDRILQNG